MLETKLGITNEVELVKEEERITFNKQKIEEVLPFDLVKRDKRYIEAYIIEAIKEYKKSKH